MKWAKLQPKDGDLVLVCAHIEKPGDLHWLKAGDQWICICNACEAAHRDDLRKVLIAGKRRWTGNEPAVAEPD